MIEERIVTLCENRGGIDRVVRCSCGVGNRYVARRVEVTVF